MIENDCDDEIDEFDEDDFVDEDDDTFPNICKECGTEHDEDLLCAGCQRCLLVNGDQFYEDNVGLIYFECNICGQECTIDVSTITNSKYLSDVQKDQGPAEIENTFDEEWGVESEGEFPTDPPKRLIESEESYKEWLKNKAKRKFNL